MIGIGQGFGDANIEVVQQNKRAQEQHDVKMERDKLYNAKMQEKANTMATTTSQAEELKVEVDTLKKENDNTKKVHVAEKVKNSLNYALSNTDTTSTDDAIHQLESDPLVMENLKLKPGQMRRAHTEDRDRLAKDYMSAGVGQDKAYAMADKSIATGTSLMVDNMPMDLFTISDMTNSTNFSITPVTDMIEKNKANIIKAGDPVEEVKPDAKDKTAKTVSDVKGTPSANDALLAKMVADGTMTQAEADRAKKRTTELGAMTNEEAMKDIKVTPDLKDETYTNIDPKTVSDIGLPETVDLNKPVIVSTPSGEDVSVQAHGDGTKTATTRNGVAVTSKKDGGLNITEKNGRKTQVTPDGKTISVASDGTVQTGYKLPIGVQMAADALGISSAYADNKDPMSAAGKFAQDYADNGQGTYEEGFKMYMATQAKTKTNLSAEQSMVKNANTDYAAGKITKVERDELIKEAANLKDTKETYMSPEQAATEQAKKDFLKDGDVTKYNKSLKAAANLKDTKEGVAKEWTSFYDEWQKDPNNKGRSIADARQDYKAHKPDTASEKNVTNPQLVQNFIRDNKIDPTTDAGKEQIREYSQAIEGMSISEIEAITKLAEKAVGKRKPLESKSDYAKRVNNEIIRIKRNPNKPEKQGDKAKSLSDYNTNKKEALLQVNMARDDNAPMAESLADITPEEWSKLDPDVKQSMKDYRKLAGIKLTDGDKNRIVTNTKTINALKKLANSYNEDLSGLAQNATNVIQQFIGSEFYNTAKIEDKAAVDSILASLTLLEAKEINGGKSVSKQVLETIKDEIMALGKSDKAVVTKYKALIQKAGENQTILKQMYGDDYSLYSENPANNVGGELGGDSNKTGGENLDKAQTATYNEFF